MKKLKNFLKNLINSCIGRSTTAINDGDTYNSEESSRTDPYSSEGFNSVQAELDMDLGLGLGEDLALPRNPTRDSNLPNFEVADFEAIQLMRENSVYQLNSESNQK